MRSTTPKSPGLSLALCSTWLFVVILCISCAKDPGNETDAVQKLRGLGASVRLKPAISVNLFRVKVSDSDMLLIKQLDNLMILNLNSTNVGDEGIKHLRELRSIVELGLGNTKITDSGLEQLSGLTGIQDLNLRNTNVDGSGLGKLKKLGVKV